MASSSQAEDALHEETIQEAGRDEAGTPQADVGLVLDVLRRHGCVYEEDIVYIGGSVADGLATPWSDVDVFVIRADAPPADAGVHLVPMPHDEVPMDLELWPLGEVEGLLDKLSEIQVKAAVDHRAFMRLTEDERDFLHGLAGAVCAHNEPGLRRLQARLNPRLLADLSVARALMGISNAQTDLLGWHALGDWQSAAYSCRRLLEFAALALLGAAGSTHLGGKWVNRLLRQHFAAREVPPRLLDGRATLAERYHSLGIGPASDEPVWRLALECVHFTNLAAIYAQTDCGAIDDAVLRQVFWSQPMPAPPGGRNVGPELALAAQIRYSGNQWYLLHVAGDMFEINSTAAAMLLLMDGRVTVDNALSSLEHASSRSRAELQQSLRDMLLFLDNANLLER